MYTQGTAWESSNREITATLEYYDISLSTPAWKNADSSGNSKIKSFTFSENASNGKAITFGTCNSSCLNISLINVVSTLKNRLAKGDFVRLSLTATATGYTDSTVMLGYFVIDEAKWTPRYTNNYDGELTCYDYFYLTDKKAELSAPNGSITIRTAIGLIATACGVEADLAKWSNALTISSYPEEISYRQLIGYLAGLQGDIAFFDRSGKLSAKWYTKASNSFYIPMDKEYMDGLVFDNGSTGNTVTIKILESGTADNTISYGGDYSIGESISFENPYMTLEQLTAIYNSKVKQSNSYLIEFVPMTCKWTGNPTIELCQTMMAEYKSGRYDLFLMERQITFDGGLYETYVCRGENEETITFSRTFNMQTVKRRISSFEQALLEANEQINDVRLANTGVFSLLKNSTSEKTNIGWQIVGSKATPTSSVTPVIRATINGIVLGNMTDETGAMVNPVVAIYVDSNGGHINGSLINAQSITTEMLNFDPITTNNLNTKVQNAINTQGIVVSASQVQGLDLSQYVKNNVLDTKIGQYIESTTGRTQLNQYYATLNTLRGLCTDNDCTIIDGATIATGTITASQLVIGDFTNYCRVEDCTRTDDYSKNPYKFLYDTTNARYQWLPSYTTDSIYGTINLGEKIPFQDGIGFRVVGDVLNQCIYSSSGCNALVTFLVYYTDGSAGWFNAIDLGDSGNEYIPYNSGNTYTHWDKHYIIRASKLASGKTASSIRPVIVFKNASLSAGSVLPSSGQLYIKNLGIYSETADAGTIVAGKLSSADGSTYFDLTNNELAVTSGSRRAIMLHRGGTEGSNYLDANGLFFTGVSDKPSWQSVAANECSGLYKVYGVVAGITLDYLILSNYNGNINVSANNANFECNSVSFNGGVKWSSTEEIKENIEPVTESVLPLVKDSKIYKFDYKAEVENIEPPLMQGSLDSLSSTDNSEMGFVIERETPEEVVSADGKYIKPYTMMSMNWKATQELLAKIESLEERLDGLTGNA